MPSTSDYLEDDSLSAHVPPLEINMQVWYRAQQLSIERTNFLAGLPQGSSS
jgi:hypothetical protein